MSRSSNRYVPISMPLPIGLPRAYYFAEENIPDFDENDLDSYSQWMESIPQPNNERDQNCQGPQNTGVSPQWSTKTQPSAAVADGSHRERHHIQMHEATPTSDITELFRRKQEDRYGMPQEVMVADESSPRYYFRPTTVSRVGAHRMSVDRDRSVVSAPPLPPGPLLPHHIGYYQHDEHVGPPHHAYETLVFHSTPQLHRNNLMQKGNLHCTAQIVAENPNIITNVIRPNKPPQMKPAVTVRTPRYFRRSGVFKRPSALCLPLSCELDPAVLQQRPMKTRLPSTMPAMQILSPTHRPHPQMRQMPPQDDDTSNTSRSAPPPYFEFLNDTDRNPVSPGKPGKLDQSEIERIQQIIEERTGVKENQEETCEEDIVSNNGESKQTEMEYILNHYQQMVDNRNQPSDTNKCKPCKGSNKTRKTKTSSNSKVNVGQMLKPKIPPSLKQKRASKHNVKTEEKCQKEKDKIEIERITSSVLDTLLHDLQTSGIINDETKSDIVTSESIQKIERPKTASSAKNCRNSPRNASNEKKRSTNENDVENSVTHNKSTTLIQNLHKNYNYNTQVTSSANTQDSNVSSNSQMDINQTSTSEGTEKFSKTSSSTQYMTQQHMPRKCGQNCGQEGDTIKNNINNVTRNLNCFYNQHMHEDKEQNSSTYNCDSSGQQWPPQKRALKYPHDDHTAMELHRSKSYIVNLIDRALSRELGTIPEERTSKQYMNLEARTALDLMSSPAVKNMDNDMCMEITQVLADSISTAPVKDAMPCSSTCSTPKPNCSRGEPNKLTEDLVYHQSNDEPMYIKQLKKLRWGHLKHIQREMRRLEDLEKFLDSCSSEK